jgi:hypothetical protein
MNKLTDRAISAGHTQGGESREGALGEFRESRDPELELPVGSRGD